MLGTYFYHEIIRKTIVSFGTLFNNIHIKHKNNSDNVISDLKVGLSYGPVQKFLAKIEQQEDLTKSVSITLPRMSFEMFSIEYDSTRKSSVTQSFKSSDGKNLKKVFMPVPYNIGFELNILTKLNDDALQIIEQILPFFQPAFNVTINLIDSIGEKKDVPILLESISQRDNYEGGFDDRRLLIHTLQFSAKTYLFGPVSDTTEGLIKKVDVDFYSDTNRTFAKRVQRYTATPQAKHDYDNDQTTFIPSDLSDSLTEFEVNDASSLSVSDRIILENEIMYIRSIDGNRLSVYRGYNDTGITFHKEGTVINKLTTADDALIEFGDDFGFNETVSFFSDGKTYSPSQGIDLWG